MTVSWVGPCWIWLFNPDQCFFSDIDELDVVEVVKWNHIGCSWISLEDTLSLSAASGGCEIMELDIIYLNERVKYTI